MRHIVKAFLISVFLLTASGSLWAEVEVNPDFTGTLLVTQPDGQMALVEQGDVLPELSAGSALEVVEGSFSVTTGSGDSVIIALHGYQVVLDANASVKISSELSSGVIEVLSGSVTLIDLSGNKSTLGAGETKTITVSPLENAEATAAADETSFDVEGETPPDSRNISASLFT